MYVSIWVCEHFPHFARHFRIAFHLFLFKFFTILLLCFFIFLLLHLYYCSEFLVFAAGKYTEYYFSFAHLKFNSICILAPL